MDAYVSKPIQVDEFIELVELLGEAEIGNDSPHGTRYADWRREVSGKTDAATVPFPQNSSEKPAPVFDLAEAVKKCFGKYEFFVDMAKSFSEEADSCIRAMKEARLQNNMDAVRNAAHRLKNAVVYLGSGSAMNAIAGRGKRRQVRRSQGARPVIAGPGTPGRRPEAGPGGSLPALEARSQDVPGFSSQNAHTGKFVILTPVFSLPPPKSPRPSSGYPPIPCSRREPAECVPVDDFFSTPRPSPCPAR